MRLRKPATLLAGTALTLAAFVIASCSAGDTSTDAGTGADATGPSSSQSSSPVRFASPEYRYTVTLPAGWDVNQAYSKWNGSAELVQDSLVADVFFRPSSSVISFAAAARWTHGLASYTRYLIAFTAHYHSDTCPRRPNRRVGIAIGGRPGVLLEYDCGILINIAATVKQGVGYVFTFRDDNVQAASDPTDHAVFARILRSVAFPH